MAKDESVGPRFFRMLMPGFATEMPIPVTFIKHVMKDRNREKVTLVSSTGKIWHVDLYKISKDVCFGGEGWREFVETHNLLLGYMLVFSYKGNMVFRFRVYGLESCEKLDVRCNRKAVNERSDEMAHDIEQTSSDSSPVAGRHSYIKRTLKRRKTSLEHTSEPPNRESTRNIVQPLTEKCKSMPSKKIVQTHSEEPKRKTVKARNEEHKPKSSEPPDNSSNMRKISKDQNTSKTKRRYAKNAQFKTTIRASNLTRSYVNIPARFRNSAGLSINDKEVYLRDPKAKTWLLGLHHKPDTRIYIRKGWLDFVRDNQLKIGDNYIFELMSCKNGIMHMQMRKL